MVIVGQRQPLEIGKTYRFEMADVHGVFREVAFKVIREGNYEGWIKSFFEHGGSREMLEAWLRRHNGVHYPFFYEIQTD